VRDMALEVVVFNFLITEIMHRGKLQLHHEIKAIRFA